MVKFKNKLSAALPEEEGDFEDSDSDTVPKWYNDMPPDPVDFKPLSDDEVILLREEAQKVLQNDAFHYKNKSSVGSKSQWVQTMMLKGTFRDRLAASVIAIQNSPLHELATIKSVINLVNPSNTNCIMALEVVVDLFISDLLLPGKKLRPFHKRPLALLEKLSNGNLLQRKRFLSLWYFEDQLKCEYQVLVQAIRDMGRNSIEANRKKAIVAMRKLLMENPEQEVLLLSSLVNKFGDQVKVVSSKALYELGQVLVMHPQMKSVMLEEIEKLIFRTNISPRAQYYGICFLCNYRFTENDKDVASKLIVIYIAIFKASVKKGEIDARIMSVLLLGVKRAFPYSDRDSINLDQHVNTLYRMVHIAHYGVSLHALSLLLQISNYSAEISDRFYCALYRRICHPNLINSSHRGLFINLVFQAMCKDIQFQRIKVFIKRLLQICLYVDVPLACGILMMISEIFKKIPSIKSLTLVATEFNEDTDDNSDEEHYEDAPLQDMDGDYKKTSQEKESDLKNEMLFSEEKLSEKKPVISSWCHLSNVKEGLKNQSKYLLNIDARNPMFLADELNVCTELLNLSMHFHPTVAMFAKTLLKGQSINYSGDPLKDFMRSKFLDRWVFKNPKTIAPGHGKKLYRPPGLKALPVNSEEYMNAPESSVPLEELFMYRFLKKKQAEGKYLKKKETDNDSDVSSVASEEFEMVMDQLMSGKEEIDFEEGMKKKDNEKNKRKKKRGESDEDSSSSDAEFDDENPSDLSDNEEDDFSNERAIDGNNDSEDDDDLNYDKIREEFSDLDEIGDEDGLITFDDDNDDNFAFSMSDVEKDDIERKASKKGKKSIAKDKKTKMKRFDNNVFVPVEKFSEMLENTGEEFAKYRNFANVSNKDNAGMKQLKWESSRNQWTNKMHGKRKNHREFSKKREKKFKRQ